MQGDQENHLSNITGSKTTNLEHFYSSLTITQQGWCEPPPAGGASHTSCRNGCLALYRSKEGKAEECCWQYHSVMCRQVEENMGSNSISLVASMAWQDKVFSSHHATFFIVFYVYSQNIILLPSHTVDLHPLYGHISFTISHISLQCETILTYLHRFPSGQSHHKHPWPILQINDLEAEKLGEKVNMGKCSSMIYYNDPSLVI